MDHGKRKWIWGSAANPRYLSLTLAGSGVDTVLFMFTQSKTFVQSWLSFDLSWKFNHALLILAAFKICEKLMISELLCNMATMLNWTEGGAHCTLLGGNDADVLPCGSDTNLARQSGMLHFCLNLSILYDFTIKNVLKVKIRHWQDNVARLATLRTPRRGIEWRNHNWEMNKV